MDTNFTSVADLLGQYCSFKQYGAEDMKANNGKCRLTAKKPIGDVQFLSFGLKKGQHYNNAFNKGFDLKNLPQINWYKHFQFIQIIKTAREWFVDALVQSLYT